jgi:hypothetical protein
LLIEEITGGGYVKGTYYDWNGVAHEASFWPSLLRPVGTTRSSLGHEDVLRAALGARLRAQIASTVDEAVTKLIDDVIRPRLDALLQAELKERLP